MKRMCKLGGNHFAYLVFENLGSSSVSYERILGLSS